MATHKLGVISGGSGSSKFVRALEEYLPSHSLQPHYVSNVGDNFWHYGLYICPDVDIVMYTLANCLDEKNGWGIKNDSFNFVRSYSQVYPEETWFNLGDSDLALSLRRTELLRAGWKLSKITDLFRKLLHVKNPIIPATDDRLQTYIYVEGRYIHLQEFWVKNRGKQRVDKVLYSGIRSARPNPAARRALSDKVLILPANPVSSILPTLNLPLIRSDLKKASSVVAISPFAGTKPFSGPASKFMRALGAEASSYGVAKLYSDFIHVFLVHRGEDDGVIKKIRGLGVECVRTNTWIRKPKDKKKLVTEIVEML